MKEESIEKQKYRPVFEGRIKSRTESSTMYFSPREHTRIGAAVYEKDGRKKRVTGISHTGALPPGVENLGSAEGWVLKKRILPPSSPLGRKLLVSLIQGACWTVYQAMRLLLFAKGRNWKAGSEEARKKMATLAATTIYK